MNKTTKQNDEFKLYDLKVEVVKGKKDFLCSHKEGDAFFVIGENLTFMDTKAFSMYALAVLLPLLPAKQRMTNKNDWMTTDTEVACPDPNCGARFRITRLKKRTYKHSDVTAVPLKDK